MKLESKSRLEDVKIIDHEFKFERHSSQKVIAIRFQMFQFLLLTSLFFISIS